MSGKLSKKTELFTSTQSAKKPTPRTLATPRKLETSLMALGEVNVVSRASSSPLAEVYKTEEFKNEWANDLRFHIARNLLHLRRHRRMSQSAVGEAAGTSQSAVARIESAQENITLETLQRLVVAMRGRFYVSIYPQECPFNQPVPWWEALGAANDNPGSVKGYIAKSGATSDRLVVALERAPIDNRSTTPQLQIAG